MHKKLNRQFIIFNILVITCVVAIIMTGILLSGKSNVTFHRIAITAAACFVMVVFASIVLSRVALAPVKKAWQRQLDFTADASHELRTPLTVMQLNMEIVLDNPEATVESQKKWLENVLNENIRMTKLVDNLLTLSRADTNKQTLEMCSIMLDEAISKAVMPLEAAASANNIELILKIDPEIHFYGDRKRLQQLSVILVDNAIKYMNRPGKITVSLCKKEKYVFLEVSDTGTGIEPNDISNIFNRFFRASKPNKNQTEGSGLGLPIAKWIVESHKGTISVRSKVDEGTVFTVRLPEVRH